MIWMAHKTNTRPNLDFTLYALMDNAYRGSLREQRSFVRPFHCQEYNSILKEDFYYDSTIRMHCTCVPVILMVTHYGVTHRLWKCKG